MAYLQCTIVTGSACVLQVRASGSLTNPTVFSVDGNQGRLLEVTDDLSCSLFSANTIAGLPVVEAFANYCVSMGQFGGHKFEVTCTGIRGGKCTTASGYYSVVAGGCCNESLGGPANPFGAVGTFVGGGYYNCAVVSLARPIGFPNVAPFVGGGQGNLACASGAVVVGGGPSVVSFGCAGTNNRAAGINSFVGGGSVNCATGQASVVVGGCANCATQTVSTVSGGYLNTASSYYATVSGGRNNIAGSSRSTVGGGEANCSCSAYSTISGGRCNVAANGGSTIGGGLCNRVTGAYSFVGAGQCNSACGNWSGILGGLCNLIPGSCNNIHIIGSCIAANTNNFTFVNNLCCTGGGISDCRAKNTIEPIRFGLHELTQLQPVSYCWNGDLSCHKKYGFLAQDVQRVMSCVVTCNQLHRLGPDGTQVLGSEGEPLLQFEKDAVYASYINAIKELKQENDQLKARVEAIEEVLKNNNLL